MATLPSKPQPGDLITSEFMNALVDVCADLQVRLTRLESPAASVTRTKISDLLPSGTKRIGDVMHILGEGFNAPGKTSVLIDSIEVLATRGPVQDKELIVTIPNLQGIGTGGKVITLLVSNLNGSDTEDFQVFPAVATIPQGQLFIGLASSPPEALNPGTKPIFEYTVRAILNLAERFQLEASTAAGWNCDIVDASGNPIADPTLDLQAAPPPNGVTATVRVQVSIPATPAVTTSKLRLTVKSTRNVALVGTSGGEDLPVGGAAPTPEPINVSFDVVEATNPITQPAPTFVDGVVKIPAAKGAYRLTMQAKPLKAGVQYTKRIEALGDNRWTASFRRTSVVTEETLGPVATGTMETFFVFVTAASGAPAEELTVRITSTTDPADKGHTDQQISVA